uniref:Monocarboxylate transporter 12 n=1 Tax=Magallana gigas TaxID=29159 RepID=A0A8W8IP41_MAGGI
MDEENIGNPVDTGWSWVILFASASISFLHIGSLKAFGLFFVEFLEMFDASVSVTSLIVSIQNVFYALIALPVLSIGIRFLSSRSLCFIGAILCTSAYAMSVFAMNVEFLIFTLSVVFGCGSGFLFPPTLVILGRYFRKRRGLANGLSMASACLGSLAYPLFIRFCMDEYGVRGALLLISGIYMHIFIAVCLLTPPEQYRPKTNRKLQEKENLLNPLVVDTSVNDSSLSSSLPNIRVPREPVRKRRTMTISEDINPSNSNDRRTLNFSKYLSNISLMSISTVDISLQKSNNVKKKDMKWVVSGFLSDNPRIRTSHIIVVPMFAIGTISQFARFLNSFSTFSAFVTIYGFFAGTPFALFSAMTSKIVGIEKFPTAYAFLILAQTCTFATVIPLSGYLRDVTGNYNAACHFIGTNAFLSVILFLFEPFAQRIDQKRKLNVQTIIVHNGDSAKH